MLNQCATVERPNTLTSEANVAEPKEGQTHVIGVIDNDPRFCKALARLLQMLGHRTELFGSVADFARPAELNSLSCLLVDAELAAVSGADLAGKLSKFSSEIPIVLMSSSDDDVHGRHRELGAVAILRKPFSDGQLVAAIGKAFDQSRRR